MEFFSRSFPEPCWFNAGRIGFIAFQECYFFLQKFILYTNAAKFSIGDFMKLALFNTLSITNR